ncbi:MAG: hypothetical protein QHJ73_15750, partial [Armatimonadota bacterium]|nr:hypothetical protein [Armatimonadota bacterium]
MRRWVTWALALLAVSAAAQEAERVLPVRVDGHMVAPVEEALYRQIKAAQEDPQARCTVAIDGGAAEPLTLSREMLRDFQNVYYRISGKPGAWRLEEAMYSPTGEDAESRLIRRALRVPDTEKIHMLPGREHLLAPAQWRVVLTVGGKAWTFALEKPAGSGGETPGAQPSRPTRAVVVRAGQLIPLVLDEALNSATARPGTAVTLRVARDVAADGLTAIPEGTRAAATVVRVHRPRLGGIPAAVVLQLSTVPAVDGTPVPLQNAAGRVPSVVIRAGPGGLFGRGPEVNAAPGTPVPARVAKNV